MANKKKVEKEYGVKLIEKPKMSQYDVIILVVAHNQFKKLSVKKINSYGKKKRIIYDLKYLLDYKDSDIRL